MVLSFLKASLLPFHCHDNSHIRVDRGNEYHISLLNNFLLYRPAYLEKKVQMYTIVGLLGLSTKLVIFGQVTRLETVRP